MGKVLDARVEPVLSASAVDNVVRLNGPLVRFFAIFSNTEIFLSVYGRSCK